MRPLLPAFLLTTLVVSAASCGGDGSDAANAPADTLTRAQRDSVIGASSLPGAGAVRRAIGTADSANARQQGLDSVRAP